jgi:hypothetical protein
MPNYRTESTFPVSVDNFVIKQSFDGDLPNADQPAEALIKASHWNHYFGACENISSYLRSTNRFGNSILGTTSTVCAFGSDVLLGTVLYTTTVASSSTSLSLTVPSAFGTTPFEDLGFSFGHTLYVRSSAYPASSVEGAWANKPDSTTDTFFDLIEDTYGYGSVEPVSGRVYNYHINLVDPIPASNRYRAWIDNFQDSNQTLWNSSFGGNSPNTFYFAGGTLFIQSKGNSYSVGVPWNMVSTTWTYRVPKVMQAENYEVIARNIKITPWFNSPSAGYVVNRGGLAVRMQGTPTNATFYGLSFGDNTVGSRQYARLFRVSSWNLAASGGTDGTLEAWTYRNPSEPYCSGTASAISPYIDLTTVFGEGNNSLGGTNANPRYVKLSVIDSTVAVATSINNSTWTTVYSVVDPSPIAGKGYPGLWSTWVPEPTSSSLVKGLSFIQGDVDSTLQARALSSGSSSYDVTLRLLYCKIGPSNYISFTDTTAGV